MLTALLNKIDQFYTRYDYVKNKDELLLFVLKMLLLKFLLDKGRLVLSPEVKRSLKNDFTINHMMALWKGGGLKEDWFEEDKRPLSAVIFADVLDFISGVSFENENTGHLGEIYEECLHRAHKKSQGIFYTPEPMAELMASLGVSVYKKERILDPACGSGSLLSAVYDLILKNTRDTEKERVHRELLQKRIFGIDKDPLAVLATKLMLVLKGEQYVYPENIRCADSLTEDIFEPESFEVIIGNPPYVGHKEIDSDYMKALKTKYAAVYQNKGDLSYCFFEKAHGLLSEKGRLLFLTSRYYMEAYNGLALRRYLAEQYKMLKIIDFNGLRLIKGVGIDPALTLLEKNGDHSGSFEVSKFHVHKGKIKETKVYIEDLITGRGLYHESFEVKRQTLKEGNFLLYSPMTQAIVKKIEEKSPFSLDNVVDSFQGIITGNDKVFIFENEALPDYHFDAKLLHPWIKNKDVQPFYVKPSQKTILYTNEMEDIEEYPYEEVYLKPFKEKLLKRRECKSGRLKWYAIQWGRCPMLFKQKKIVFPYKATKARFAIDEAGYFFSADVYGLVLKKRLYHHINEEFLVLLLNSRLYNFYFHAYAKKLGSDLYEYYPNTLLKLKIPEMDEETSGKFKELYDKITLFIKNQEKNEKNEENEDIKHGKALLAEVDEWFYTYFNINDDEIKRIEGA